MFFFIALLSCTDCYLFARGSEIKKWDRKNSGRKPRLHRNLTPILIVVTTSCCQAWYRLTKTIENYYANWHVISKYAICFTMGLNVWLAIRFNYNFAKLNYRDWLEVASTTTFLFSRLLGWSYASPSRQSNTFANCVVWMYCCPYIRRDAVTAMALAEVDIDAYAEMANARCQKATTCRLISQVVVWAFDYRNCRQWFSICRFAVILFVACCITAHVNSNSLLTVYLK